MGRTPSSPASGGFVRRQLSAIKNIAGESFQLSYFEMPQKATQTQANLKRYAIFFGAFINQHIFTKKTYAILHVHFFFPTILLAISYKVFRNPKVKIVTTFHGNDVYAYQNAPWWYKMCHNFVDHSIFVSKKLKEQFFKQSLNHSILCAGILPVFSSDAPAGNTKKYDFIFVGTLDKNKGALRLIELAKALSADENIVIVGAGPYKDDFIKLSQHSNIDYFHYRDEDQLVSLYQRAKWLVNLSYNESFGLVISEAMACGLPVIATETDGSLSQITEGYNGVTVEQNQNIASNVLAYTKRISLADYEKLSNNAKASVESFLLPNVAKEILNIYVEVTRK
jgi:glycosyltransferase involved in cell wall biosynthesis